MALDLVYGPGGKSLDELLLHEQVEDLLGVMLLHHQPSPAGIMELLSKCEGLANLLHGQHPEVLVVLLCRMA